MPRRAPPATYSDVIPLWQKCLQNNGLRIQCLDGKKAEKLRSRLNGYRASLRKQQSDRIAGLDPQLQHDQYEVKIDLATVIISPRFVFENISLTDLAGAPVVLDEDNDLFDI